MYGRVLKYFAIACIFIGPTAAAEPIRRLSFDLPEARWQLLPEAVRAVYVGPDGRLWYQLNGDSLGRAHSVLRSTLEAEYRQPSPQIAGALIALLEPGGRAWFYVNATNELWGFDGQSWIERKAPTG